MELTIITPPATLWDAFSDTSYPARLRYGYDVYAETGDLTTQSKWIYVLLVNGVSQTIDIPSGYEYYKTVKPNAGFSNTGDKIKFPVDAGLYALSQAYAGLNFLYTDANTPNWVTYDQLAAIDLTLIDKEDFRFTLKDGVIKNWSANP